MPLLTVRHDSVFSSVQFNERKLACSIIGAGATGSRIVLGLAKLGIANITVFDGDLVDTVNIANQAYGLEHVGMPKAEAIADIVKKATGAEITAHTEYLDRESAHRLSGYVFLLTDTMSSRKEIWEAKLKLNSKVQCVVETRMGKLEGRVYLFNPLHQSHAERWQETLVDDAQTVESACGTSISVGPTAEMLSGFAQALFVEHFNSTVDPEKIMPPNEIIYAINPPCMLVNTF